MDIRFVAGVTPITTDATASAAFYRDALGLPLEGEQGGYLSTDRLDGVRHFGVWPLEAAARSCFGGPEWPDDVPIPSATIEFDVASPGAVAAAAKELESRGHRLVHPAKTEEWGQTVARVLSPEGLLVGITHTPWMHGTG